MLAIAAPSFNCPSETFIRSHVWTIAPGNTILLCRDGKAVDTFGCPVLRDIDPLRRSQWVGERIVNAVRHRWRAYVEPGLGRQHRRRVVAFLRSHHARAVLAEFGPMGCLLMEACQEAAVPLYVYFHGADVSAHLQAHRVRHYKRLFTHAAGIIAPSRFLAGKLQEMGCPTQKLHVNPCGVDPVRFSPSVLIPGRVAAVGRLVEKKAPHLTIQAFARIASRFPGARLDIIGDGPFWDRSVALIARLGLGNRIMLHGEQDSDQVAALMRQVSLFVQHSVTAENGDTEGMPVAILEAMASALPVVSTVHSGICEAVEHGTTGLLVPEYDVSSMAEAMAALLADTERARCMGVAGRARVLDRFTIEHSRDHLRTIMGLPEIPSTVAARQAGVC